VTLKAPSLTAWHGVSFFATHRKDCEAIEAPPRRKGLSAYRAQRWEDACNSLRAALEITPNDGPSLALLKRIEDFQTSPPASNWDGVWHMDHK
jgi:hypothetical protein